MKWIEEKMKLLGCANHPDYKIFFYMDQLAMISIQTPKYGLVNVSNKSKKQFRFEINMNRVFLVIFCNNVTLNIFL